MNLREVLQGAQGREGAAGTHHRLALRLCFGIKNEGIQRRQRMRDCSGDPVEEAAAPMLHTNDEEAPRPSFTICEGDQMQIWKEKHAPEAATKPMTAHPWIWMRIRSGLFSIAAAIDRSINHNEGMSSERVAAKQSRVSQQATSIEQTAPRLANAQMPQHKQATASKQAQNSHAPTMASMPPFSASRLRFVSAPRIRTERASESGRTHESQCQELGTRRTTPTGVDSQNSE